MKKVIVSLKMPKKVFLKNIELNIFLEKCQVHVDLQNAVKVNNDFKTIVKANLTLLNKILIK